MRLAEGRAVVVEPIPIGHRIRDLAELSNRVIALKTDDNFLLFLEPIDATRMTDLHPVERGKVIATGCAGCHSLAADGTDGIGPALWSIVGRTPPAGLSSFLLVMILTNIIAKPHPMVSVR